MVGTISAVLAKVCRIRCIPGSSIHGTVLTLRNTILEENVSIEESADRATAQMIDVVLAFGLTSRGASSRVKGRTIIPHLICDVAVAVRWSVD